MAANTLFWKKGTFTGSRDENLDKYFLGPLFNLPQGSKQSSEEHKKLEQEGKPLTAQAA